MKKIINYLTMFFATSIFWIVSAMMFITSVALCVAIPAALGLGFYQILKDLGLGFYQILKAI